MKVHITNTGFIYLNGHMAACLIRCKRYFHSYRVESLSGLLLTGLACPSTRLRWKLSYTARASYTTREDALAVFFLRRYQLACQVRRRNMNPQVARFIIQAFDDNEPDIFNIMSDWCAENNENLWSMRARLCDITAQHLDTARKTITPQTTASSWSTPRGAWPIRNAMKWQPKLGLSDCRAWDLIQKIAATDRKKY